MSRVQPGIEVLCKSRSNEVKFLSVIAGRFRKSEGLRVAFAASTAFLVVFCIGCGGGPTKAVLPPQALSVTAQPSSQGVKLGQPATFSVTVSGSDPISYQWKKDGVAIDGAISSSYMISATSAADNDSTYSVTISNAAGSVVSNSARLLLNVPVIGDLRFQQVDAAATRDGYQGSVGTAILGGIAIGWQGYGSPFELTPLDHCSADGNPRDCGWLFSLFSGPPPGFFTSYQSGFLSDMQADLNQLGFDTVVTSLDVEPANNAYATSTMKSNVPAVFSPVTARSVLSSDFQSVASQEGAVGHVITALGFDSGTVRFISYGWQADTNVYEVSVASATLDTMPTQAAVLAQQGYIITAVGGDITNGFLLVGTRVQGDTMPRPFKVITTPAGDVSGQLWQQGYALIAAIDNGKDTAITWLGEK